MQPSPIPERAGVAAPAEGAHAHPQPFTRRIDCAPVPRQTAVTEPPPGGSHGMGAGCGPAGGA
ncbi:MAG TPA: hypothetical protein VF541_15130 [Longimicrobium sp.]